MSNPNPTFFTRRLTLAHHILLADPSTSWKLTPKQLEQRRVVCGVKVSKQLLHLVRNALCVLTRRPLAIPT